LKSATGCYNTILKYILHKNLRILFQIFRYCVYLNIYTVSKNLKDLREVGWDGRDWIYLAQDRERWRAYVNAVMNLRIP
jgi:hypothetical protein